jgi:hypothetical protein
MMYLFNSTEWCYIKRTTDNVLQILLQASRWRVKTANTILQIPWKKVNSYANTPTWSKNSANSQCKAWICKKISRLIWGRCNLKRSRRTVIFLPVYKISSLKITPPKTQNSGQFSYPLPNIVSFLFEKKSTRVPV